MREREREGMSAILLYMDDCCVYAGVCVQRTPYTFLLMYILAFAIYKYKLHKYVFCTQCYTLHSLHPPTHHSALLYTAV